MKASSLTFVRYGLLILAILMFLVGAGVSGCSGPTSDLDKYAPNKGFKEITWPSNDLTSLIPEPESNFGKINHESSTSFDVSIGNTSEDEYDAYVIKCMEYGFNVDYSKMDGFFDADNADGFSLSVNYIDFYDDPYMEISLNAPVDKTSSVATSNQASSSSETTTTTDDASDAPVDGIRPSFKEAMDSYEAFFDEYCDFMKKYNDNPSSPTLLADYAKFATQYAETMDKLDSMGEEDMSPQELQYYTDTMNRINTKLADVVSVM